MSKNKGTYSIRSDWMITTGTDVITGLAVFIAAPIAAARLGPTGRGTLVAVQLLPQILADLSSVGLGFAMIHFGSRKPSSIKALWRWSLKRCAVGAAVLFALGQLTVPLLANNPSDRNMLRVYLLLCPLVAFTAVPFEATRALGKFGQWNLFKMVRQLMWPAALLIGVLQSEPSLWLVVWLHIAATVLILFVVGITVWRQVKHQTEEPDTTQANYLSYGIRSALSTIPTSANAKLDQLVMAAVVTRDNLGLYAAAAGWSQITLPVMRGLIAVSMPFVSGAQEDSQLYRVRRLNTLGILCVIILSAGGIVATLVLWRPIYGEEFYSAMSAALVLMVATALMQYGQLMANMLRSLERPGLVTWIEAAVLVLSTGALFIAVQVEPVMGASLVSLMTYVISGAVYVIVIARRLQTSTRDLFDVRLVSDGWERFKSARR